MHNDKVVLVKDVTDANVVVVEGTVCEQEPVSFVRRLFRSPVCKAGVWCLVIVVYMVASYRNTVTMDGSLRSPFGLQHDGGVVDRSVDAIMSNMVATRCEWDKKYARRMAAQILKKCGDTEEAAKLTALADGE